MFALYATVNHPTEHGADWSDWQPGDDGDSCLCGFNGTSQECEQSRAVPPTHPTDPVTPKAGTP